jgi:hypothetical protein
MGGRALEPFRSDWPCSTDEAANWDDQEKPRAVVAPGLLCAAVNHESGGS